MAFSYDDSVLLDEIDESLQAAVEPTCGMFSKSSQVSALGFRFSAEQRSGCVSPA
jgi:hypothetical protein